MRRARDRITQHRGVQITVRWTELERPPERWGPRGHRFVGSFRLGLPDAPWQHLHQPVFLSYEAAAAHALGEACRAIDAMQRPAPAHARSAAQAGPEATLPASALHAVGAAAGVQPGRASP